MLLVTGPTGSGKTTTLYAAITEINHGFDKLITIEDPVEYQLAGVLQIPVNEKKGLTLRARAALDPAPRPRQDHGGRDPRPRDGADRGAGRADRAPGVHHRAREQRVRRDRPFHAHGRGPLQLRVGAQRHRRAAAGARELHALRERGGARRAAACRVRADGRAGARLATCGRGAAAGTAAAPASAAARPSPRSWCSTTRSAS